jgi:hypothetical protein
VDEACPGAVVCVRCSTGGGHVWCWLGRAAEASATWHGCQRSGGTWQSSSRRRGMVKRCSLSWSG